MDNAGITPVMNVGGYGYGYGDGLGGGANQTITVTTEGTQSVASSFAAVVRVNACNTSALSITSSAAITVTNATMKVIED